MKFNQKKGILTVENNLISFEFDTNSGFMDVMDKKKQIYVVSKAFSSISYSSEILNTIDESEIRWDVEECEEELGKGISLKLHFQSKLEKPKFILIVKLFENRPFIIFQNAIFNNLKENIRIKSFFPFKLSSRHLGRLNLGRSINDWKILAGAYQSWSPLKLLDPFDKDQVPRAPESIIRAAKIILSNPKEKRKKNEILGDNYIVIKNLKTKSNILLGFITFQNQFSQILYQSNKKKRNLKKIFARSQADNIKIEPNEKLTSESLLINFITPPLENLQLYAEIVGNLNKALQWEKVPTGYCTWYIYYTKINEEECLKNLNFIAERHDQIPVIFFQLDDGYQKKIGDWEENKKFPSGMKALVEKVEENGFLAGIWVAPFLVGKKSKLFKKHPNWVLRNEKGKPIVVNKNPNWGLLNPIFGLDCSHPEVQNWLHSLFTKITNNWGFKCVKIDFIYATCATTNFYDKKMTRAQVYRKGIKIIRDAIGPDVLLLGCGAPIGPSIGLVNAMRVSPDTHFSWNPFYCKLARKLFRVHSVPCVINAMKNNIRSFFMHKKLWINDPDCLMVRLKKTHLSEDEVKSEITCIGLLNGYYFLSDNFAKVDEKQVALIKKFFPFNGNTAIPIDLFESEMPQILDLPITKEFDSWHVVGIFNWSDKKRNIKLNFEDLGLEKSKEYHVFEFWEQKYYGIHKGEITFSKLKKHSCKLITIKEVKSTPQLLSTTFHFTQGAIEIKKYNYDNKSKKLQLSIEFPGKNVGCLFFFNPQETKWQIITPENAKLIKRSNKIYQLEVDFENNLDLTISCD